MDSPKFRTSPLRARRKPKTTPSAPHTRHTEIFFTSPNFKPHGSLYASLQLLSRHRVGHAELFMVERGVGAELQFAFQALLHFHQHLFVLVLQSLQYVGMNEDAERQALCLVAFMLL